MSAMLGGILPNLIVVTAIAVMAIYGWRQGLFLATVAGLHVLTSLLVGIAFVPEVAAFVISWGVVQHQGLATAFFFLFGLGIVAVRLAVGAGVPRDAISFAPIIDTIGGAVVGAVAGGVVAGGILIGWSMAALPGWAQLDVERLEFDPGSHMLATFSRCVQPSGPGRDVLLNGEPFATVADDNTPQCSEPFVDANRNGVFDDGERYLDTDGNGHFTSQRPFIDVNGSRRRDFGLLECYRLAAWRNLSALHAPRITSPRVLDVTRDDEAEALLYQASVLDQDPDDLPIFTLKPREKDDAGDLEIEATTGRVFFVEPPNLDGRRTYRFTVVATDRHGLFTEQPVRVTVRPVAR